MSSQPSTKDSIKSTAFSTYDTIASTIGSSQNQTDAEKKKEDLQKQKKKNGDYRHELNEAAKGARQKETQPGVIEKGT